MALPTPLRFESIDALPVQTAARLPVSLQIASTPIFYKALLLRLLTGTTEIRCNKTADVISQPIDYSTLKWRHNSRITRGILRRAIRPVGLADYDRSIQQTNSQHFVFYSDIYYEFCAYFFKQHHQNYLSAFVHLYRILERISYAFPLFWAARAKNYERTFETLRKYFSDPKIGELGVFKKFVPDFMPTTALQLQLDLNIVSAHADWQRRHYELLLSLLASNVVAFNPHSQVTMRYENLIDLMITIRNRYFHALTGHSNSFNAQQMVDFDEFSSFLNPDIANWLAFILFQIFEFELR
jgi:hypothetical protein